MLVLWLRCPLNRWGALFVATLLLIPVLIPALLWLRCWWLLGQPVNRSFFLRIWFRLLRWPDHIRRLLFLNINILRGRFLTRPNKGWVLLSTLSRFLEIILILTWWLLLLHLWPILRLRGNRGQRDIANVVTWIDVILGSEWLLEVHLIVLVEFLLFWYGTSSPGFLCLIVTHSWVVVAAHTHVLPKVLRCHALVWALVR